MTPVTSRGFFMNAISGSWRPLRIGTLRSFFVERKHILRVANLATRSFIPSMPRFRMKSLPNLLPSPGEVRAPVTGRRLALQPTTKRASRSVFERRVEFKPPPAFCPVSTPESRRTPAGSACSSATFTRPVRSSSASPLSVKRLARKASAISRAFASAGFSLSNLFVPSV